MRNNERLYPTVKFCCKCECIKPRSEFNKNKGRSDGINSYCKDCNKTYMKKWEKTDRGRRSHKKYYNTIKGCLAHAFYRAKSRCGNPNNDSYRWYGKRGIRFQFKSLNEFRKYVINDLKVDPRGLECDRINPNGHYEKGNIRFITHLENNNNRRNSKNRI